MSKGFIATLAFLFGAGAGSLVTYKLLKTKYSQFAEDTIAEMREYYSQKNSQGENLTSKEEAAERAREKADIMSYAKEIEDNGYSEESQVKEEPFGPIEYIDEEELGDIEDYDLITLTYYSDGILADDEDEEVEDFIDKVGNFTTHFEGSDVLYVKNDDYQAYYEIVKDDRTYVEVTGYSDEDED